MIEEDKLKGVDPVLSIELGQSTTEKVELGQNSLFVVCNGELVFIYYSTAGS